MKRTSSSRDILCWIFFSHLYIRIRTNYFISITSLVLLCTSYIFSVNLTNLHLCSSPWLLIWPNNPLVPHTPFTYFSFTHLAYFHHLFMLACQKATHYISTPWWTWLLLVGVSKWCEPSWGRFYGYIPQKWLFGSWQAISCLVAIVSWWQNET